MAWNEDEKFHFISHLSRMNGALRGICFCWVSLWQGRQTPKWNWKFRQKFPLICLTFGRYAKCKFFVFYISDLFRGSRKRKSSFCVQTKRVIIEKCHDVVASHKQFLVQERVGLEFDISKTEVCDPTHGGTGFFLILQTFFFDIIGSWCLRVRELPGKQVVSEHIGNVSWL